MALRRALDHTFPDQVESKGSGGVLVIPPPLVATKLALHETTRAEPITRPGLARRLLDLDHRPPIDQIDRALAALHMRDWKT